MIHKKTADPVEAAVFRVKSGMAYFVFSITTGESVGAPVGAASISLNLGRGRSFGGFESLVQHPHDVRRTAKMPAEAMVMRRIMMKWI